jgi:hypothetical protein
MSRYSTSAISLGSTHVAFGFPTGRVNLDFGLASASSRRHRPGEADPDKFKDVLAKVDFLEGLGLPTKDASVAAGSTAASVQVMRSRSKTRKANGKTSKVRGRKR